jgi:hypothetical protein
LHWFHRKEGLFLFGGFGGFVIDEIEWTSHEETGSIERRKKEGKKNGRIQKMEEGSEKKRADRKDQTRRLVEVMGRKDGISDNHGRARVEAIGFGSNTAISRRKIQRQCPRCV